MVTCYYCYYYYSTIVASAVSCLLFGLIVIELLLISIIDVFTGAILKGFLLTMVGSN